MTCWRIRLWWADPHGSFEAGADVGLPITFGAVEAIQEVAKMRNVDLSICTTIEAKRGPASDEYDVEDRAVRP